MAAIFIASSTSTLYGSVWAGEQAPDEPPAWGVKPQTWTASGNPDGSPAYYYLYTQPASTWPQSPFFRGYLRSSYAVHVTPESGEVEVVNQALTPGGLTAFQELFPDDPKARDLTLQQLEQYAEGKDFRGSTADPLPGSPVKRSALTECQWAIAGVAVDVIFVITGAYGLHGKVNASSLEAVAHVIEPAMTELEEAAAKIASSETSAWDKAMAIKDFAHVIWSGGMVEPVFKAILQSLTWWDAALYGCLGMAVIAAAFLTDGAALVAMIAAELVQVGFVVSDSVKAVTACSS